MKYLLLSFVFYFGFVPHLAAEYKKVTQHKLFNGETLHEFQLDNGLKILTVPRHQAKVLTYQVWFRVGSIDEKLDPKLKKTGLAHLFEHMMFRGTTRFPGNLFDRITARMGAVGQNASTYYYRTNYYESIPSSQLETLIEIEADRMQNLKITPKNFANEKGAVVGERRRWLESPVSSGFLELFKVAYQKAPYRSHILGSEENIKGFTLEEANYFYRTYYAPNNASIIVIGDVEPIPLVKLIHKYYGAMKPQEVPRHKLPVEPPQKRERKASPSPSPGHFTRSPHCVPHSHCRLSRYCST